jgi:hypothetical protein
MKKSAFIISLLLTACVFSACDSFKLRKIKLNVEVQRFDKDLFALNPDSLAEQLPALQQRYGEFFTYYCSGIIDVGEPQDADFVANLRAFLTDEVVRESYEAAQEVFPDEKSLNEQLTNAFKRHKLAFPNDSIPKVISYVSGFNQSIMLTEGVLGLGLDKYLGASYDLYSQLGFYRYMIRNMYPDKLLSDAMRAWAEGQYPQHPSQSDLVSRMVWEGRLYYFVKQMLPSAPDTCVFGFSGEQLTSCESNEGYMWLHLIENKLLYSSHPFTVAKFTQERPFTQEFSREAPGRAANWLGYRIVQQYMKRNPSVTLAQLMREQDYRKILDNSGYNPR